MAVQVSKSGGIYIEISGDVSKLDAALKEAERLSKTSGSSISESLSRAINPQNAARTVNNLAKYMRTAGSAAKSMSADLSTYDQHFKNIGREIGIAEKNLGSFAEMNRRALQTQTQNAFLGNLKGIQRLTGATDAEMNRLAKSLGGVGNEFSKANEQGRAFSDALSKVGALAGAYISLRGIGDFASTGIGANATFQEASTGIAAMLSYTQQYRDSQGRMLEGQEAFNAALAESEKIAKAVDISTRTASASYTQLLEAFQETLGATSKAGGSWQDNLELLNLSSNAINVLRGDMGRLGREVKNLLSGRDLQNSIILRGLPNISPDTIKSWIRSGEIVDRLKESLQGFGYAGEAAANSFNSVRRDLAGTFESLAEEATKGAFPQLTQAMKDLSNTFYTVEGTGANSVYVLRKEIAPLVQAGQDIGTWFGERLVGSVSAFSSSVETLSSFIGNNRAALEATAKAAGYLAAGYATIQIANKNIVPAFLNATSSVIDFSNRIQESRNKVEAFASVGRTVFTALGGWTTVAAAAAAGVFYLASAEREGEKYARQYAETLGLISKGGATAKNAIEQMREEVERMSEAQKGSTLRTLRESLQNQLSGLETYLPSVAIELGSVPTGPYVEIVSMIKEGKASADELRDAVYKVHKAFGDTETRDVLLKQIDQVYLLREQISALEDNTNAFKLAIESIPRLTEVQIALRVAGASGLTNIGSNIKKTIAGIQSYFDFSEGEKLIQDYASKSGAAMLESLTAEREKIQRAFKGKSLFLSGDELTGLTRDYERAMAEVNSKITSLQKKGGSGSRTNEAAKALAEVNDQIARLTMTEKEYAQLNLDKKIADYAKLGVSADSLEKLRAAISGAEMKRSFDEASKALQDFERQYQAAFQNSGDIAASIQSDMEKFRVAAVQAYGEASSEMQEFEARYAQLAERMRENASTDMLDGARRTFRAYAEEAGNAAKNIETAINSSFSSMEDALVNFATTGKLEFSSLVDSIIADMARIATRQFITAPLAGGLQSLISGALGGGWTSGLSESLGSGLGFTGGSLDLGLAKGGVVSSGLSAYSNSVVSSPVAFDASGLMPFAKGGVFGEAGPEAVVPLVRTSSGDLGVQTTGSGGGASSAPIININVYNETDSQVDVQQGFDDSGNVQIDMYILSVVNRDISRGGNTMSNISSQLARRNKTAFRV